MDEEVEFVRREEKGTSDRHLSTRSIKVAGIAKLQNVTHDGTCGYRCIAQQDGIPVEDVIQRFFQLSSDEAFLKEKVI